MPRIGRGWLLILLTFVLIVLTCLQARGSLLTRGIQLVNKSRGYSVFVLRAISELAGLSLSATISTTWERIKWALVCRAANGRGGRVKFLDFLALDEGTKTLALFSLLGGRDGPTAKTRLWSVARLLFMVVIPVTGILIMSQVEIQLAFSKESNHPVYMGYDMAPMNASMAYEYLGLTDLMLSYNFAAILTNPSRSIDLTPESDRTGFCGLNAATDGQSATSGCRRKYFIAGEILFSAPELINDPSFPEADIILATNHRGFYLEFDKGDSSMKFDAAECRTYSSRYFGAAAGAVRLCVGRSGPNELQGRLVSCPGTIAAQQRCTNDTSWFDNVDWTVKMSAYLQYASVAYSRSNGSIIWYSANDVPPEPVNVTSAEILQAYDALLLDTTTIFRQNNSDVTQFSGSSFPVLLWMTEPVFSGQNATNPATLNAVFAGLQALLATPLYLCQNGLVRRLLPVALDAKSMSTAGGLDGLIALASPLPNRTSPASFAYHRYEVVASMPTLIAYMVLSGVAMVCCCVAQFLIGMTGRNRDEGGGMMKPKLSRFPALDLFAHCTIEDGSRYVVYQGRSGTFHYDSLESSQTRWLSTLSVKWSRPAGSEGLQMFGAEMDKRDDISWDGGSPLPRGAMDRSATSLIRGRDGPEPIPRGFI